MEERNFFERLVDVSSGMEIWWDSSPVIFENWCKKVLEQADPAAREILQIVDRCFVISRGKVLVSGSSDDVLANETVRKEYLGDISQGEFREAEEDWQDEETHVRGRRRRRAG